MGTEQKQGRKAAHSGTCFFNYILYNNNSILEFLEDFHACHVTHHIENTVKSRLEVHDSLFRLLMKGIFDPCVQVNLF